MVVSLNSRLESNKEEEEGSAQTQMVSYLSTDINLEEEAM